MAVKRTQYGYRADWRDRQGNRYRRTFKLRKEAEDFLATVKVDIKNGDFLSAKTAPLFREVAEQWFENKRTHRPATLSQYRKDLDLYLLPAFGDRRFSEIDVTTVERQRNQWLERKNSRCRTGHLAPEQVNKLMARGSSIGEFARKRKMSIGNPFKDADRLKCDNEELTADAAPHRRDPLEVSLDEVPSPEEVGHLLDHATPGFYQTLFMCAAFTGGRHDELLSLEWPDFDLELEDGSVHFQRSLTWARLPGEDVRGRFYRTKTKAGNRTVPLAPELVHQLKLWKLQCPPSERGLVFPTPDGKPMRRDIVLRSGLYPALKRAKLRKWDMHTLRHFFASALIADGASVTEVQSYLGHTTPTTTLRIYTHFFQQAKTDSIRRLTRSVLAGTWTPNGHLKRQEAEKGAVTS